jgi:adenosylhomocysteine nucleosidase
LGRVGIVAALASEARAFAAEARVGARRGEVIELEEEALLTVSGIGWQAALLAAQRLAAAGATALASVGTAGGLDPELPCGAVLLPAEVHVLDGPPRVSDARWRAAVRAALPRDCTVSEGALLTSRVPIGARLDKAIAWRETGCVALDMESAAVAQFAASTAVPFVGLRVIVDTARDELPAAVLAASAGGELAIGRLLWGLARSPRDIVAVRRLARRFRTACDSLARLGEPGLPPRRALCGGPWRTRA